MWQRFKFWRQFSLKTLLLAMFVAAVFCGAYRIGFNAGRSERIAAQNASYQSLTQMLSYSLAPSGTQANPGGIAITNLNGTVYVANSDGSVTYAALSAAIDQTAEQPAETPESPTP
jgi:hypothetical protein